MATRPVINFGSCCIDHVYSVPHFVRPGETLPSTRYEIHPGGKGLNQSLALKRAGASIHHAGKLGQDGAWLKELLTTSGVDTTRLLEIDAPSGHAIIQVIPEGQNSIILFGGANQLVTISDFDAVLSDSEPGDWLLIQNELSETASLIDYASARDQRIVFNAAPMTDAVLDYPLDKIDTFIVNEVEAEALCGEANIQMMPKAMLDRFPKANIVLTLGEMGAVFINAKAQYQQPAFTVDAVDTTAAGDTFIGYFLASIARGLAIPECLELACKASAICVTRHGAASSVPTPDELSILG